MGQQPGQMVISKKVKSTETKLDLKLYLQTIQSRIFDFENGLFRWDKFYTKSIGSSRRADEEPLFERNIEFHLTVSGRERT